MSARIADIEGEEMGQRDVYMHIMSEWAEVMGVEAGGHCRFMFGGKTLVYSHHRFAFGPSPYPISNDVNIRVV